ncbi:MAG: DHH family phosphoesterase [Metamycoplasmataceae bacterium]
MEIKTKKAINKLIEEHETIIIFHHINPDGDCLGSQFGLKELLKTNFPQKTVLAIGNSFNVLNFMNFKHDKIPSKKIINQALAIIVDCGNLDRIQNAEIIKDNKFKNILRIDHHPSSDDLPESKFLWVDPTFSSSCEQITLLAKTLKWEITSIAAEYLYLGLITDSGWFFYEKTSSRTHNMASLLLEEDKFDFFSLHNKLKKRNIKDIKFNSEVLKNFKTNGNVIYYIVTNEISKKLKLDANEKNKVNFLANIDTFPIWIFFIEDIDKTYRVRIRSNGPAINILASKYNGGGHQLASGAKVKNKREILKFVNDANKLANDYLKSLK